MAIYGYHRTSIKEQHLDRGINEITEFCKDNHYKLEKIYTDQQTGKNFSRPRYTVLRDDILREGDTLIITEFAVFRYRSGIYRCSFIKRDCLF